MTQQTTSRRTAARGVINVSDPAVATRIRFMGLTEEDLGVVASWREACEDGLEELVDRFYAHILANPDTKSIIDANTTVARQRPILTRYIQTLFTGRIDDDYVAMRDKVGRVHDRIDLDSNWYIAMYGVIRAVLDESVAKAGATPEENQEFISSFTKLAQFDMALTITALTDSRGERARQTGEAFQRDLDAIGKSAAIIEFDPDGTIRHANPLFFQVMGYSLGEVKGQHHSMFVGSAERMSVEYRGFWDSLARGQAQSGEFRRFAQDGSEVWLQANYNPVFDEDGRVCKVVKVATDITVDKLRNADYRGQIEGISNSQAVISFHPDGTIIEANDNFCGAIGYRLDEIRGQHHSMFVETEFRNSPAYGQFWQALARGEAQTGDFKRIGKGGRVIWINASYTPIRDVDGNVFKVVKYATDITETKDTVNELNRLIAAAKEGQLDVRAGTQGVSGDNLTMRTNINEMLDAIAQPIHEISGVLERVANKDLTAVVEGVYAGAMDELKQSVNAAIAQLHQSMDQVSESTRQVASAADQIAASSQSVAQGASEQASALEETSASLEEMSQQTKQNADNTLQAKALASSTQDIAKGGSAAMGRMLDAMGRIKKSAEDTSAIIKDINEIAFQTNLLALNAAVEAARAGDAGRGFAVVAEEVRNLALRAKEAANKTESLIAQSAKLADEGGKISGEVSVSLDEIMSSVGKVTDIVTEIAAASEEQARGIDQVNRAVTEMDKVTQRAAANSEESSSAAEELAGQAQELTSMVGDFQLNGQQPLRYTPDVPVAPRGVTRTNGSGYPAPRKVAPKKVVNGSAAMFPLDDDEALAQF